MIRLFRVSIPTSVVVLVLSDLLLVIACYLVAGLFALNAAIDPVFYLLYENGLVQLLFVVAVIPIGFYLMDLYDDLMLRSRTMLVQQLCVLLGISFLIQALLGYDGNSILQAPQWTMLYGSALVLVVIPAWRITFFKLIRKALPNRKILFLGVSPAMEEVATTLQTRRDLGFTGIGYLADKPSFREIPYLGTAQDLQAVVATHKPDRLVVALTDQAQFPIEKLMALRMSRLPVELVAGLYETIFGRVSVRDLQASQVIFSAELSPRPWTVRLQAMYSFVLGVVGLMLSLPIMGLVAFAVKLSSPGPVLYSQKRLGLAGQPFQLYKFRSMYIDAEARTGPVWATKNDPRVTPLGRWLRKLRLDELPQFFNVIRGEMALVGPRPERPEFCEMLNEKIPFYNQRLLVKPGVTGWAQINHMYTETVEDTVTKLEYDLYYVKHLAPALDAYIIFHTLKVMLLFRGAQ